MSLQSPVLILGSKGMLGQVLADEFSAYETLLWDKDELDITNKEAVLEQIRQLQPAVIINAAAYNLVDNAEEPEGERIANAVNTDAPGFIAEAAAQVGAFFVHVSTDYVFSGIEDDGKVRTHPYVEIDTVSPQSVYASSKRGGEERVLAIEGKNYVVRTSRLYGPPAVGENAKRSFVDVMLQLAAERDRLQVVNEEIASPTYVVDLAKQIHVLLRGAAEGEYKPGIYHGTNEGSCTWYEFAQQIFKLRNIDIVVEPVPASQFPRPAARPAYSVIANTKLPKMREWEAALADYLSSNN